MSRNIAMLCYSTTASAAWGTGTAAAALTGDSLEFGSTRGPSKIIHWNHLAQTAGSGVRLIHQSGHDQSEGMPMTVAAGDLGNLLPRGMSIPVHPSETLRITAYGAATSGKVDSGMMLVERDVPGVGGEYIGFGELRDRTQSLVNVRVTLAASAAGYGTEETLKAETDYLWGDRKYALLGITSDTNVAAVYIRGLDTGNQKIGAPGNAVDAWPRGSDFFAELSRVFGGEYIPVINSGNKASTFLGFVADEVVTSIKATYHFALLK